MLEFIDTKKQKIYALEGENDKLLHNQALSNEKRVLDMERHSYKSCFVFHGLDASDPPDAVVKVINEQMFFLSKTKTSRPVISFSK